MDSPPLNSLKQDLIDSSTRRESQAFSLVELLGVMALVAILISLTVPALSGISNASRASANIAELAGLLDQARLLAVSSGSYVWLALGESERDGGKVVEAAVIQSKQSPNLTTIWDLPTSIDIPSNAYEQVGKIVKLPQSSAIFEIPELSAAFGSQVNGAFPLANGGPVFNIRAGGQSSTFDRVILFTPRGEARVNPSAVGRVALALRSGTQSQPDVQGVKINILTGQVQVIRL